MRVSRRRSGYVLCKCEQPFLAAERPASICEAASRHQSRRSAAIWSFLLWPVWSLPAASRSSGQTPLDKHMNVFAGGVEFLQFRRRRQQADPARQQSSRFLRQDAHPVQHPRVRETARDVHLRQPRIEVNRGREPSTTGSVRFLNHRPCLAAISPRTSQPLPATERYPLHPVNLHHPGHLTLIERPGVERGEVFE